MGNCCGGGEGDRSVRACSLCLKQFSVFKKRKACPNCDRTVCGKCCHTTATVNGATRRICDFCVREAHNRHTHATFHSTHNTHFTATAFAAGTMPRASQPPPQQQCPHCHAFISGTFAVSHIEMCRQRAAREAKAAKDAQRRRTSTTEECPHCKTMIDAAFVDSHVETCKTQTRRRRVADGAVQCEHCNEWLHPILAAAHMRVCKLGTAFAHDLTAGGEEDEENLCVICFDEKKGVAFMPCGHWACCVTCSVRLTECPMCRQSIDERMQIAGNTGATVCPVCHVHIHPTFYDSHREVCRLQMKQARAAAREDAEGDDEAKAAAAAAAPRDATLCTLCYDLPRDVATVPCGHYSMCRYCASTVKSCPVCCASIRSVLPLYS